MTEAGGRERCWPLRRTNGPFVLPHLTDRGTSPVAVVDSPPAKERARAYVQRFFVARIQACATNAHGRWKAWQSRARPMGERPDPKHDQLSPNSTKPELTKHPDAGPKTKSRKKNTVSQVPNPPPHPGCLCASALSLCPLPSGRRSSPRSDGIALCPPSATRKRSHAPPGLPLYPFCPFAPLTMPMLVGSPLFSPPPPATYHHRRPACPDLSECAPLAVPDFCSPFPTPEL